jgi:hypothetical protein
LAGITAAATPKAKPQLPKEAPTPRQPAITTIVAAKQAYRAGRIDKYAYKQIVNRLEDEYDRRVRETKLDYKAGKFTKDEYRRRISAIRLRYIGED